VVEMALWIPISLFEDLGGAKRKSFYKISTSPDISLPDEYSHCIIKCMVRYPNGETREETASFKTSNYLSSYGAPFVPRSIKRYLKRELREKIRRNAVQKALSGSEIISSA
jgi:hypothetical protein